MPSKLIPKPERKEVIQTLVAQYRGVRELSIGSGDIFQFDVYERDNDNQQHKRTVTVRGPATILVIEGNE